MNEARKSMRTLIASAMRQTFIPARPETTPESIRGRRVVFAAAVAAAALMTGGSAPRAHTRTTQVTWTADVEPIVAARCVRCHQSNGFAPMSLASYGDAKRYAAAIRTEVLSGRMPPWPAAPGYGDFSNDAHLSAIETELIARWADGGAPLGPPVAPPRAAAPSDRAESVRIDLPATTVSGSAVRRIAVPVTLDRDRFLSRWTFEPGARSLVEEATLVVNGTIIGAWTPFDDSIALPARVADRLPKDAAVSVAVRYRRTSAPAIDRSVLTLSFARQPARSLQHLVAGCGEHRFDRDVDLWAVKPTASAAGDPIEVVAYGSDGAVTPLAVVSRYRPEYAVTYRMRTPVHVARGSHVDVRSPSAGCAALIDYVNR